MQSMDWVPWVPSVRVSRRSFTLQSWTHPHPKWICLPPAAPVAREIHQPLT